MSIKHGSNRFFPRGGESSGVVPPGAGLWSLYGGSVVGLTTITQTVAVGANAMLADEELRVEGGIASTTATNTAFLQVGAGDSTSLSGASSFRLIFNAATSQAEISTNGGAFVPLLGGGGGTSFVQNGNSFAATAVLGTNDAFDLVFETNALARARFTTGGSFLLGTSSATYSEKLGLLNAFAGSASYKTAAYIKTTTSGADAGGSGGLVVETAQTTGTSAYHEGLNVVARSETTGAMTQLVGASVQVTTLNAGASGTITTAYGIFTGIGHFGAGTAAITSAYSIFVSQPQTAAGRTIGTSVGVLVANQGNTGITAAIGIDVSAQSGATATNLGIRSQSPVVIGTTVVSGTESLRVAAGGVLVDGSALTASVTSTLSLNNSGGPIQIGNNADAQGINIGTGAAARSINIGNTTGSSSVANSFGTNGFGLIQAAANGVTPVGVLMTAGAHTALPNVETADVNFNLARTVTFSGGGAAITNQRAYRVQAPTYAAAAAQTITTASTLEISGQPVQGANVTLTAVGVTAGAYALNVATGNSRFGGSVFVRDTATGPGVQGLYSTDSSGNGFRVYQLSSTQTFWTNQGSTNTLIIQPSVAIQGTVLNPFSDGTIDLGGPGNRWRDLYTLRTQIKEHAAFTGSAQITGTGAVQTTDATVTTAYTSPTLLDNSSYWVEVWITARDTGSANRAMYQRLACIYRQGGGVATILTGTLAPVTVESVAAWNADIDVTGNTFRVRVTGAAATTINWTCTVRYQGVSGNV